ncbi:DUF2330 domain-containing protein [Patulibacter defluvii]|uniref:DUF2330 domain-containing protein n=1 Tax=Patulibacter defluvii TaxID=3095358 RepID=UPI002A763827|nr:DUF2330 domain-containing protein [Patulibacter sp. DM4]
MPLLRRLSRPSLLLVALVVALAVALVAFARPAGACACGIAFDATVAQEQAIVSLKDGRESIVLSLDLAEPEGAAAGDRRAAVLLPVPATPTVTAVRADQVDVFDQLARATAPLPEESDGGGNGDGDGAPASGAPAVKLLSRERVGGYDVSRLRAGDARALRRWLNDHGYRTPAAADAILRRYVAERWAFVAIRLAPRSVDGSSRALRPLRVAFASERLVYPLRLSRLSPRPVTAVLYVVGEHRVLAKGFDTHHAGLVADLSPAPTAAVRRLLDGRYLTKLQISGRTPSSITEDVAVRQAPSDRLFRATADYPFESEAGFATSPLPPDPTATRSTRPPGAPGSATWLLLFPAVALAVVATGVLFRLRGRRRSNS